MSPERSWKIRLEDMLICIAKIKAYTLGMTFEKFRDDDKTVDAVIGNFEIIGEAAGHIPLEIQEKYPESAWLEMRGMRNIVAHEYFWHQPFDYLARDLEGFASSGYRLGKIIRFGRLNWHWGGIDN